MIMWTPMPLEAVLDGFLAGGPRPREVRVGEAILLVEEAGAGVGRIVRLISGEPYDYLKPEWAPGALIRLP
ncbi:MAG TPA: YlzJ-like family protein [Bacillota bacterium]|jgi:hypothetical protein